jgi:hypothetical protein
MVRDGRVERFRQDFVDCVEMIALRDVEIEIVPLSSVIRPVANGGFDLSQQIGDGREIVGLDENRRGHPLPLEIGFVAHPVVFLPRSDRIGDLARRHLALRQGAMALASGARQIGDRRIVARPAASRTGVITRFRGVGVRRGERCIDVMFAHVSIILRNVSTIGASTIDSSKSRDATSTNRFRE